MLGHAPFYHKHFRKYVSVFGTLFNDISIERANKTGGTKTIKVPLAFADKDTLLARLRQDPELQNVWRQSLPRMAFTMGSPFYAPDRKENSVNFSKRDVDGLRAEMNYAPAPYDIPFTLSILTNYYEDGLQIVEQILPFFQPEYTVSVKEVPELDIKRDVHIVLDSVDLMSDYEGEFDNGRMIEWTLMFTLKGFFYGPATTQEVIKETIVDTYFKPDFEDWNIRDQATVNPFNASEDDPYTIDETRIEK